MNGISRGRALVVRYWARNMTLVHDQGATWPGFGYTPDEKDALRAIARRVPGAEFYLWMALVVVIVLLVIGAAVIGGDTLVSRLYPGATMPEPVFFVSMALEMVAALALGLPLAMWPASLITGKLFAIADADLPDPQAAGHYAHKLWLQIARMAVLGSVAVLALCLFVPDRVWLLTRFVVPILGPAVSLLTACYYFMRKPTVSPGKAA